jgi:hypothetical protein
MVALISDGCDPLPWWGHFAPLRFWPGLCASPTAPFSESAPEELRAKVKGTN